MVKKIHSEYQFHKNQAAEKLVVLSIKFLVFLSFSLSLFLFPFLSLFFSSLPFPFLLLEVLAKFSSRCQHSNSTAKLHNMPPLKCPPSLPHCPHFRCCFLGLLSKETTPNQVLISGSALGSIPTKAKMFTSDKHIYFEI